MRPALLIAVLGIWPACSGPGAEPDRGDTPPARESGRPSPGPVDAATSRPAPPVSSDPSTTTPSPGSAVHIPEAVDHRDIVAVTVLSPRSMSLKIRLRGGAFKVFKPIMKNDDRARYEVAAYLLAHHLRVPGVPPARLSKLPLGLLTHRLARGDAAFAAKLTDTALQHGGWILGAQIDWMTELDPDGITKHGGLAALRRWLSPGRPKEALEPMLSRPLSNIVVFDFLIGNWDRFSGGNLFINKRADEFVLIDHNGAFARWGSERRARMIERLEQTERFSRSFIGRVRGIDAADIEAALAAHTEDPRKKELPDSERRGARSARRDDEGLAAPDREGATPQNGMDRRSKMGRIAFAGPETDAPLLSRKEIEYMLERRDALIAHVDALIERNGRERTLVFE